MRRSLPLILGTPTSWQPPISPRTSVGPPTTSSSSTWGQVSRPFRSSTTWPEWPRSNHLSLFGTQLAAQLEHQGLTVDRTPPITYILRPIYGSTVTGQVLIDAVASEPYYGTTRVEFTIAPESHGSSTLIGLASDSLYGWILRWKSPSVPNGRYLLRSTAFDTIGTSSTSVGVLITVNN